MLGAATIANWDKLTGSRATAPVVTTDTRPATSGPSAAARDADKLGDSQRNAYDAASVALDDVASRISASTTPDIGGKWRSSEGYGFTVVQNGAAYSFQEYAPDSSWVGSGSGQLTGRQFQQDFRAPELGVTAAQCGGDIAADGKSISGNCYDRNSGKRWGYRLDR